MNSIGNIAGGPPERSVVEILTDIVGNVQAIIRGEIRLAKTELRDEARKSSSSIRLLLAGGVLGILGAAFLLLSAVYALTLLMPAWAAAGIVGLILALASWGLFESGTTDWNHHFRQPGKPIETNKEEVSHG